VADAFVDRLADVVVGYSTAIEPGDLVVIEAGDAAAPLVRAVYERVLRAGGHPDVRILLDELAETLFSNGTDAQLEWVNPSRLEELRRVDVRIVLEGETNTRALSDVDPRRQALAAKARDELRAINFERAAAGELRWLITAFPTNAGAQEAQMPLGEYERFVYHAGFLDREDPVAEWQRFGTELGRLAEWLGETRELRVVANGTDLRLGVGGRTWIPCDGKENFPDGEVFTAPLEDSLEGEIHFSYPASFQGRLIEGIRLRFADGEVVDASASRGGEFLEEMLAVDDGARRVGEFAFGLNDAVAEFTHNTLFDEKMGGTVHLALGRAYPESGGVNTSALHWDLVCDLRSGSEVYADGELVYRDGRFLAKPS